MGLLVDGKPLSWEATELLAEHIRNHGITQFLNIWDKTKGRVCHEFLWGDEIEYMVAALDHKHKTAKLSLRQSSATLDKLQQEDCLDPDLIKDKPAGSAKLPTFHHEYGRYMIESTPGAPFSDTLSSLLAVEADMRFRRQIIYSKLEPFESRLTITSWPRMGVKDAAFAEAPVDMGLVECSGQCGDVDKLLQNSDHPRFGALNGNIVQRRGGKTDIHIPLFIDKETLKQQGREAPLYPFSSSYFFESAPASDVPSIVMDAMSYGIGCCCLQVTCQASSVVEARRVYDALVPVAPIMLALTAASPVFQGQLADHDTRWNVVATSVDDRTEAEKSVKCSDALIRPRWHSVNLYIAEDERNKAEYNDVEVPINVLAKKRLAASGVDNKMADHIAHIFIRDPLIQMSDAIDQDDETSTIHFDGINTASWPSVRFKPPPLDSAMGWRVELRTMEVQMTDFENAAFAVFVVLLNRAIVWFDLDFYVPISKVDENMERAHQRNAAAVNKFAFRKDIFPPEGSLDSESTVDIQEMSLDQIINGDGGGFPGLMGVVEGYLKIVGADEDAMDGISKYLELIKLRAKGDLPTPATWIRDFITYHPAYKQDSLVSDEINYDLIKTIHEM
ncbi:hypothetical protein I350_06681 [Cryptococcus amylolentus CBS 6273]|uniref:Glutamate--cysteine ligase n=1 Tax=Cryptococcus amylolentus CBS 6273 TaxID=1296118 RepID=A0A1E3JIZ1_9TREE|nr:hypothetical protein I350_06681 [Cryptococcus amylolentus CBS 6273]